MKRVVVALVMLCAIARAHADPNPKRKVIVLEYRAASASLPGIAARVFATLSKQTSLQLLGPDQTRAVYGDHLDQVIVKCAGDAECIARIGQKVGAADVILVAISELGDVILTMQRIDVSARSVSARIADSFAASATPSEDQLDGYLTRLLPPGDFLRYGVIDIVVNLAGAAVTVAHQPRGLSPIEPLKLHAPATYDIRVEKSGYVPFTTKVVLPPDGEIKVEAQLSRRGREAAWYQHWYVLAAGSVLIAGAAGTTIFFATRTTATPADSVPVTGVLQ